MVVDLIAAMLSLPVLVGAVVSASPSTEHPPYVGHPQYVSHMFNPHVVIDETQIIDRTRS